MKNILTLFFLCVALMSRAGGPANKQTIDFNNWDAAQIKVLVEMDPGVTHLVITGPGSSRQVNQLLKSFEESKSLFSIEFLDVQFESLSDAILDIPHLQMICIKGNLNVDLEETLGVLEQMPGLRSLEIEVAALEDLPKALFEMEQLDRLVLHEHLLEGETKAAECIAMEIDMQKEGSFSRSIKAYVYLSSASWTKMQGFDEFAGLRKIKPCQPMVKKYEHVNPPILAQDIQSTSRVIDAEMGGAFIMGGNRSTVRVPANAFVDANGAAVDGDVTLTYREFTDAGDFIASGIPMSFEKDSALYYYESAGMVEVNAAVDGKEVFLADGKSIDILMSVSDNSSDMDVWTFDDVTGSWNDVGNSAPASVAATRSFVTVSQAVQMFYRSPLIAINRVDSTSFENRFRSPFYYHSTATRGKNVISTSGYEKNKHFRKANKRIGMRIKSVNKNKEGDIYFKFVGNRFLHPELRLLKNNYWLLEDPMDKAELRANFGRRHRYGDLRVVERDGQTFLLLKEGTAIRELAVSPVMRYADKETKKVRYEKTTWPVKSYRKSLERRRIRFDKGVARKFKKQSKRIAATENRVKREVSKLMTDEEREMEWDQFVAYAKAQADAYQVQMKRSNEMFGMVSRILSVNRLGLCNIDRLQSVPNQQVVSVEILVNNQPTLLNGMFIGVRNVSTVLSAPVTNDRVTQRVTVFGDNTGSILFITAENRFGVVPREAIIAAVESNKGIIQINAELLPEDYKLEDIEL